VSGAGLFEVSAYGAHVEAILAEAEAGERLMPLVMPQQGIPIPAALRNAEPKVLFPSARAPEAALAGLLLYFDRSAEAHAIAQDLETPEGSFWHAILHRREPDAGNSAYWFRKTGQHPVFPDIARAAQQVIARNPEVTFTTGNRWNPFSFIDFCESVRDGSDTRSLRAAQEIQRAEWQILFDFCARAAG
jgi:hypothetical protein